MEKTIGAFIMRRQFGKVLQEVVVRGDRYIVERQEDNKFLECAIAGEATYIVSDDAHLLALRNYRGIEILTPSVLLAVLEQGRDE